MEAMEAMAAPKVKRDRAAKETRTGKVACQEKISAQCHPQSHRK